MERSVALNISSELNKKIVTFLTTLPNIDDIAGRKAFIKHVGFDKQLQEQIDFSGSSGQFVELLVSQLVRYGQLEDGRNALEAVLEAAKDYVGRDRKAYCETLLQELHAFLKNSTTSSVLHNLPQPDYEKFIGREIELEQIHQLLLPDHRSWVITIEGIGGIGKSALALEVAHSYLCQYDKLQKEKRFEAIIWITAKQIILTGGGKIRRSSPLCTLKEIYTTIGVTLDRGDIINAHGTVQDHLVRQALTQQRTLLIIDNLETVDDKESVIVFIQEIPHPTKVIVTTRHRIDVADYCPIRLDVITQKDAMQLIEDTAKRKGVRLAANESKQLYHQIGGVPLAITWSVAKISFGSYTVERVLKLLREEPPSDIIQFCFEKALEQIKEKPAYTLLLALSLFAEDASREALGKIVNLTEEFDLDDGLAILEKLSLINKSEGRFSLLPLIKGFANRRLKENTIIEKSLRSSFISYFQEFCQKFGGEEFCLYSNIEMEFKNIQLALEWAYQSKMWKEVGDLVTNLAHFMDKQGLWGELIDYAELAVEAGRELNDNQLIMEHKIFSLGWVKAIRLRELDAGLFSIEEGKKLAKKEGNNYQYARALRNKGHVFQKKGEYDKAESLLQQSLAIWRDIKEPRWEIRTLGSLGENELECKNLVKAEKYCSEALEKSKQHEETELMALNLSRLSHISLKKDNFEKARSNAQKAIEVYKQLHMIYDTAPCYFLLATSEYSLGNIQKAKNHVDKACELFLEAKNHVDKAYDLFLKMGKQTRLEQAKKLSDALDKALDSIK